MCNCLLFYLCVQLKNKSDLFHENVGILINMSLNLSNWSKWNFRNGWDWKFHDLKKLTQETKKFLAYVSQQNGPAFANI